jgi:hypothetical protein
MSDVQTLPMTVAHTGFLLERMAKDCDPLQYLREFMQNAVEAIQRTPEQTGIVRFGVSELFYDLPDLPADKRVKLQIVDNGVGMTGEEMTRYINALSSSGGEQSHQQNFGVGAKIAAATQNPEGVLYLSWKDGIGEMVHLWRDPATGNYGLKLFDDAATGKRHHYITVDDVFKPKGIDQHGTAVILLGADDAANTMLPPPAAGIKAQTRWILPYLNKRYFELPAGIQVEAEEYSQTTDMIRNRVVKGQKHYLDDNADSQGTVPLSNATAHWWILPDDPQIRRGGEWAASGHTAALYQGELYEPTAGRTATAMVQEFGVSLAPHRVVIYVQPDIEALPTLGADTARSRLLIDGQPLPWADWASEFRAALPTEIHDLVEGLSESTVDNSARSAKITDRINEIAGQFAVTRFQPEQNGTDLAEGAVKPPAKPAAAENELKAGGGEKKKSGNSTSRLLNSFADTGAAATRKKLGVVAQPSIQWLSIADRTRAVDDDLEGRAARYLPATNQLQINADFSVFVNMEAELCAKHQNKSGAAAVVHDTVQEWYQQSLTETVMAAQAMQGTPGWAQNHIDALLSPEGLTAAALSARWLHATRAAASVGVRLGKKPKQTAEHNGVGAAETAKPSKGNGNGNTPTAAAPAAKTPALAAKPKPVRREAHNPGYG